MEDIIKEVKGDFKSILVKRKELVLKLGRAIGKESDGSESVCEQIKNILKEEIAEGLISARAIEMYCPDEWKKHTKPKRKNENIAFSKEADQRIIAVVNDGLSQILDDNMVPERHDKKKLANSLHHSFKGNENTKIEECLACIEKQDQIKELEKALEAATIFTSADKTRDNKSVILDLKRFGSEISGLVDNGATSCFLEIDASRHVIKITKEEYFAV